MFRLEREFSAFDGTSSHAQPKPDVAPSVVAATLLSNRRNY